MQIIWTRLTKITYKEISENLDWRWAIKWTIKEIIDFKKLTNEFIDGVKNVIVINLKTGEYIHSYANKKLEIQKEKYKNHLNLTIPSFYFRNKGINS